MIFLHVGAAPQAVKMLSTLNYRDLGGRSYQIVFWRHLFFLWHRPGQ